MTKDLILVLGAYGQRNLGDEAMLVRVYKELKNDRNEIYCNSANPEETTQKYGIPSFYTGLKKDFWSKVKLFLKAKTIVYGGGSILVDLRMNPLGKRALLYRQFVINCFAKLTGKKTVYCGVGVEDVSEGLSTWLLQQAVKLSFACYVRDTISLGILQKYGVDHKAKLVSDMVLQKSVENIHKESDPLKILILPVYRIIHFDKYYQSYINELVQYAISQSGMGREVNFFPIQIDPNDEFGDRKVLGDIKNILDSKMHDKAKNINFLDNPNYSPDEFTGFIQGFDLILSSRFHGLVYSLSNNIPAISITEFQKSVGLLKDFGLADLSLTSSQIDNQKLSELTEYVHSDYAKISKNIQTNMIKCTEKTVEMFNQIRESKLV